VGNSLLAHLSILQAKSGSQNDLNKMYVIPTQRLNISNAYFCNHPGSSSTFVSFETTNSWSAIFEIFPKHHLTINIFKSGNIFEKGKLEKIFSNEHVTVN